jgi:predicted transcriptional regulator
MSKRKKGDGQGQDLRNSGIFAAAAAGKKQGDIANEFGVSRKTVNQLLNSDEAKRMVEQGRSVLQTYISEAVETLADAMRDRASNMPVAVQAATTILKGLGVLNEKIDHDVKMKPFILKLHNGDEIHMGHKPESED